MKYGCIIFMGMIFLIEGCYKKSDFSTDPPKNVAKTNKERARLGVRQIKATWLFYGRRNNDEEWQYPNKYPAKTLIYNSNYQELLYEQDEYFSGNQFEDEDSPGSFFPEELIIHYDYKLDIFYLGYTGRDSVIQALLDKLHSTYFLSCDGRHGETNDETLAIADKILSGWGIKRLD